MYLCIQTVPSQNLLGVKFLMELFLGISSHCSLPSTALPPTVHLHPLCTSSCYILPPIMHFLLLYFLPLCTSLCSSSPSALTQSGLQCFLLGRSPAADCPVLTPSSAAPPVGTQGAVTASFPGHEKLTQPPLSVAAGIWPRIHP